jgi:hypothetical protein
MSPGRSPLALGRGREYMHRLAVQPTTVAVVRLRARTSLLGVSARADSPTGRPNAVLRFPHFVYSPFVARTERLEAKFRPKMRNNT